jgi:hypothetical protein
VPDDYALGILPHALAHLGPDSGFEIEIVCDLSANLAAGVQHQQLDLGSGLIDQSQKMTVAARQIAEKNVWAHRS